MLRIALALLVPLLMAREAEAEPAANAVIVQSGSTNRAGFHIAIDAAGNAEFVPTGRRSSEPDKSAEPLHKKIPGELARRFHADLDIAKPFAALPSVRCMKSASFGFTLRVEFKGETTPDLSCGDGGNTALRNLIRDVNEIAALFRE